MSDLVGNPEYQFSRVAAHLTCVIHSVFRFDCGESTYTQDELVHHRVEFDPSLPARYVLVDITSDEKHLTHMSLKNTKFVFRPITCGSRKFNFCSILTSDSSKDLRVHSVASKRIFRL